MKIRLSSIFGEPGYSFKISYKVKKLIVELLNKEAFEEKEGFDLGIIVTTGAEAKTLEVKGPDISKRYKVIDYALWMPYNAINESDNVLRSYLKYLFEGIEKVLLLEKIRTDFIPLVQRTVEAEVLDNTDYEYVAPY